MSDKPQRFRKPPTDEAALRKRAENVVASEDRIAPTAQDVQEIQRSLHELQVHQVELEMQKEELRAAHEIIEAERARYSYLYDLAPMGNCTVSEQGVILEANLTAANLLGMTRSELIKESIFRFIHKEDQDIYRLFHREVFASGKAQECELGLVKQDGGFIWGHLKATIGQSKNSTPVAGMVICDISVQHRAEEEQKKSQHFLESTLNGLPDQIAVVDETGEIIITNKAYRDFAKDNGAIPALVCEKANYLEVCDSAYGVDADYAHVFAHGLREVLADRQPFFELEYPCHSPDQRRWFVARVTQLAGEGPRLAVVTHQNVTQRKLSEQALRQFQNTLDQTLDCVFIFTSDELLFTYVNEGGIRQLGYSASELWGMHPWEIKPEFSETRFRELIAPLLSGEQASLTFETIHQHKNGSRLFVEIFLQYLEPEGESGRFIAIVRDITERKQTQQKLELLSSVASQTTNSVIITDLAGRVTWVNDGFCRLTGYALEELLGQKPGAILQGPDTDPDIVAEMRRALEKGQGFNVDVINYDKESAPYWIRIACNLLRHENGEAQGFIAIQSSIDNEKKDERLIQKRSDRTTQQRNLIAELSTDDSIVNRPLDEQLAEIVTRLSANLQADMVSVWMFAEDRGQLHRRILYDTSVGLDSKTMALDAVEFPAYFTALKIENQIDAIDAQNDLRSKELTFKYLAPLKIRSLLDTAIQQDGRLIGVLSVEHRDFMREWEDDEKTFLSAITGLIAQLFANAERKKAQAIVKDAVALQSVTLNTIVDGIVTADQNGIIQTCNPALESMFGYPKDGLIGENIKVLMPDVFAKAHDGYMRAYQHQKSKSTIMGNMRNLTAKRYDGHIFPIEVAVQETRHLDEVLYVASIRDVSELKAQQEKIESLAYYDSLTGLPNRRLLEDRIHRLNGSGPKPLAGNALLFIDIDDFKNINDALGHAAGDSLLLEAGNRISNCLSLGTETVARLGGDEFCVVLAGLDATESAVGQQAERIAERIIQELREPFLIGGDRLTVSASIGISVGCAEEIDLHVRMKRADMAMYEAKKDGKNQACVFNSEMETELLWRLKIQADLGTAIEQEALTVHYQPIVDDSGAIVKLEALVRWQHPTEGWIGPDVFIPIAESTHLIVPLGNQVLNTVLKDMENWRRAAPDVRWTVAVNISQFQLAYPHFQAQVEEILSDFNFASGRLVFEVTESTLAQNIEASIHKMQALTPLGITFSLDDFGTGYSSLEYLKRLPITELKIDKGFVDGIPDDLNDVAIIKSVRSLATEMELQVVAEGVETAEQFQFLKDLKCDRYQGYYFSKPRSASAIEELMGSRGNLSP